MKIKSIRAFPLRPDAPDTRDRRRAGWQEGTEIANPMSRYPRYKALPLQLAAALPASRLPRHRRGRHLGVRHRRLGRGRGRR